MASPFQKGRVASTAIEARHCRGIGGRVVIKIPVLVGEEAKPEASRVAKSAKEAEELATQILGMEIKGLSSGKVLVDEAANIVRNLLGIHQRPCCPPSSHHGIGRRGVEIEEVARTNRKKL